ncbi:hypothetical protein [Nocardia arizonensis]|uniref:hypothetical protein n=1 Tax=Nocardia arizonensis TaxID=1141647 RepID=UPI0006CFBB05|nr:hypothetical protein [Nocardia arizonensis]
MRGFVIPAASILAAVASAAAIAAPAAQAAPAVNCEYSEYIIGHPGMHYTCYIHHKDGTVETIYT